MDWMRSLTTLDLVMLGLLLAAFFVGWLRGIVRQLTGFIAFLCAYALAGRFTGETLVWLNQAVGLKDWMEGVLTRRLHLPPEAAMVPAQVIPWERSSQWLKGVPLPQSYREALAHRLTEWSATAGGKSAAQFLIENIATSLLTPLVFALMVLLITIVLRYVGSFLSEQLQQIPLVGTVDRLLGGLALGFELALVMGLVVLFVIPTLSLTGASSLQLAVDRAILVPYLAQFFEWLQGSILMGGSYLWTL